MKKLLVILALLLSPSVSWATITYVATLGNASATSAATTTVITASAACEVGNICHGFIAIDNDCTSSGNTTEVSVADSVGNTWARLIEYCYSEGAANDGATISLWQTKATIEIGIGATITFTHPSKTSRAARAEEWTVDTGKTLAIASGGSQQVGDNNIDPSSMVISALPSKEYLFLRLMAQETNAGSGTGTATTNYTRFTPIIADTGSTATSMRVWGERRVLTATGDTSDPTGGSSDQANVYIALEEVNVPATTRPIAPFIFQ